MGDIRRNKHESTYIIDNRNQSRNQLDKKRIEKDKRKARKIPICHQEELQRGDNCLCLQELEKNHWQDTSTADEQRDEHHTRWGESGERTTDSRWNTQGQRRRKKERQSRWTGDGSTSEAERRAAAAAANRRPSHAELNAQFAR